MIGSCGNDNELAQDYAKKIMERMDENDIGDLAILAFV